MLCQNVQWRGVSHQASADGSDSPRGSERDWLQLQGVCRRSVGLVVLEVFRRLPRSISMALGSSQSRSSCAAPVYAERGPALHPSIAPSHAREY
jgi:hypothetical protein